MAEWFRALVRWLWLSGLIRVLVRWLQPSGLGHWSAGVWPSGLGRWSCNPEVPGSSPPPCH